MRRDDFTVVRAGGDVVGAGVPRSESPKLPPRRRRGLASPGEARGVACAVGVDCWEDIMLQFCAMFAGRSLRGARLQCCDLAKLMLLVLRLSFLRASASPPQK